MDDELLQAIREYIINNNSIEELSHEDSLNAIGVVADKFIKDRKRVWWWETLLETPAILPYEGNDGISLLLSMVNDAKTTVLLYITDDEIGPWPVFRGNLREIAEMILQLRFFEYFISDESFSWLIFDTHMNSLVVSGCMREKAGEMTGRYF